MERVIPNTNNFTMWEGSSVKCHDCPLLSDEKYLDNLRKIALQII